MHDGLSRQTRRLPCVRFEELREREHLAREPHRILVVRQQVAELVAERRYAARLQPDDRNAGADRLAHRREDPMPAALRAIEESEIVERPATAERRDGSSTLKPADAEVLRRLIRIDDLARIHAPVRIEDRLELREPAHERGAEHLRQQRRARLAVAVLAGERTAVAHDEIGGLVDECAVGRDAAPRPEVEIDPRVHAALAEMAVEIAFVAVAIEQRAKIAKVRAELRRRHGRVFPAFPGDALVRHVRGRAEAGAADLPDAQLLRGAARRASSTAHRRAREARA